MRINYQLMTEANKNSRGRYVPDYDTLIKNATCEDERNAWQEAQKFTEELGLDFTFELVTCMKQACGHWEVFQHPIGTAYTVKQALSSLESESKNRRCTRCICHWEVK